MKKMMVSAIVLALLSTVALSAQARQGMRGPGMGDGAAPGMMGPMQDWDSLEINRGTFTGRLLFNDRLYPAFEVEGSVYNLMAPARVLEDFDLRHGQSLTLEGTLVVGQEGDQEVRVFRLTGGTINGQTIEMPDFRGRGWDADNGEAPQQPPYGGRNRPQGGRPGYQGRF